VLAETIFTAITKPNKFLSEGIKMYVCVVHLVKNCKAPQKVIKRKKSQNSFIFFKNVQLKRQKENTWRQINLVK